MTDLSALTAANANYFATGGTSDRVLIANNIADSTGAFLANAAASASLGHFR